MTTIPRRFASLIALALAAAASGCGGDGIVLPGESRPAKIEIIGGNNQNAPAGSTLGQPLVVKVKDALDRPVEGQMVGFAVDAGGGTVTPGSVPTGSNGEASSSWTLGSAAGQQKVLATVQGDGLPAGLVVTFNASAGSGVGALLEIASGDNQTAAVLSALPESLVVRVLDSNRNPVAGMQVDWTVSGGGSISPASVVSDATGLAKAERVLGSASGTQQGQASSPGLTPVTFTHTAEPANPTALVLVSGQNQVGAVGAILAEPLVVRLQDDNGNGVGGKPVTWVVATGGGSVNPITATTSPNGLASTTWTLGPNAGTNTLNAVFSGVPSVPFSAMAQAGTSVNLAFTQPPVNTNAGATLTPSVKVAVQDGAGNTVVSATDPVTLAIGANPGGGTLSGTVTVNAVNGIATFPGLSIDRAGNGYTLVAASGSLGGATSPTFDILTGSANHLVFIVGPTDRVVGQRFSPAIQVQVQDAGGNPVVTATNPITLTSSVTGTLSGSAVATPFLGTATFSNLAVNRAGSDYTLTALASGVASRTSDPFQVAQAATTIAITNRSPNTSVPGQNVTVSYDVNIVSPGAGSLTGNVTVSDGTTSCIGGINAGSGQGSCALAFPTAGTRSLTATYSGDVNFQSSASSSQSHTVNKANTTLNITDDRPDPSVVGEAVPVKWTLGSAGSAPLTGTVTLTAANGPESCSAPASLGAGSCDLTFDDNGSRAITATYSGDPNYNGSSDGEGHSVRGSTSTTVVSSSNPSTAGQTVTFTAHVDVVSGSAGNLSGQVRILDGETVIGQANLNNSDDAVVAVPLAEGTHSITAAYQGSSTFAPSTSTILSQKVDAVPNVAPTAGADDFTVLEDQTLSVNAGNGLLQNDDDPDSGPQPLVARSPSTPAHGSLTAFGSDGSFTYQPVADFNGTDSFTYEAFDGAAATIATVTITITAVNDAPSFTKGADQSVSVAGDQKVDGWASPFSAGPAEEPLLQAVDFRVSMTAADSGFFVEAPSIDDQGTLTYTPLLVVGGGTETATVHVRAHDDGGTANGGSDTSADQPFTIAITNP